MAAPSPHDRISGLPARLPLYLRGGRMEVVFSRNFAADDSFADHRETVVGAIKEFQAALKLGFFAWSFFPVRETASLKADWSKSGSLNLVLKTEGLHHNVLVAMLRLILGLHHTPEAARQELERILGDEAAALPPRTTFENTIEEIAISDIVAVDARLAERTDLNDYVRDGEIGLPGASTLFDDPARRFDGERIVVRGDALPGFPSAAFGRIESRFLEICGTGLFRGAARMDDAVGDEAQVFVRNKKKPEAEIVIDDFQEETYGLLEFLNVASDGRIASLRVQGEP